MTDNTPESTIEDARNKLETVAQIMAHIQAQGVHDVSIGLVEALLVPARQALAGGECSEIDESNEEEMRNVDEG